MNESSKERAWLKNQYKRQIVCKTNATNDFKVNYCNFQCRTIWLDENRISGHSVEHIAHYLHTNIIRNRWIDCSLSWCKTKTSCSIFRCTRVYDVHSTCVCVRARVFDWQNETSDKRKHKNRSSQQSENERAFTKTIPIRATILFSANIYLYLVIEIEHVR